MSLSSVLVMPANIVGEHQAKHRGPISDVVVEDGDAVRVHQTSTKSWLVRHAQVPARRGSLIGCVEERDGAFEVMIVGNGLKYSVFSTFREAIDFLTRLAATALAHTP